MKPEHIDRAALSANVEGHLGGNIPAKSREEGDDVLDQVGVTRIEKSVEAFTVPEQAKVDTSPKACRHAHERGDRDPIGTTALDPPDDRARDACPRSQLGLGQSSPQTQRSHPEPISDASIAEASLATMHCGVSGRGGRADDTLRCTYRLVGRFCRAAVRGVNDEPEREASSDAG